MSWISKIRSYFSSEPTGTATEEVVAETRAQQDLSSMKLVELRSVAKERGMKGYTRLRKAQLLDRLQNS